MTEDRSKPVVVYNNYNVGLFGLTLI